MTYNVIIWTTQDNRDWGIDDFYSSYTDLELAKSTAEGLVLDGDAVCAEVQTEDGESLFISEFDENGELNCTDLDLPESEEGDEGEEDESLTHEYSKILSDEEYWDVRLGSENDNEEVVVSKACKLLAEAYYARGNSNIEYAMEDLDQILESKPLTKYAKKQLRKAFKEKFGE